MGPLFVQVAVENTVYHFDRLFTYALPAELEQVVVPGMRVLAPFGTANKERVAMVFSVGSTGAPGVKPVLAALDREAVVSPEMLELALWMHERYYCTIFEAVRLMIPAGLQFRLKDSYVLEAGFKNFDRECFTEIQWRILLQLHTAGRSVPFEKLSKENGIT